MSDYEIQGGEDDVNLTALLDPAAVRAYALARQAQGELDLMPQVSRQRTSSLLAELNDKWPYFNEIVQVTGVVETPILEVIDSNEELSSGNLTLMQDEPAHAVFTRYKVKGHPDQVYLSEGFTIKETDEEQAVTRVRMLFKKVVYVAIAGEEEPLVMGLHCEADLDDVLVQTEARSFEYAEQLAKEYFPEFTDSLEDLAINQMTLSQKIMALRAIQVPVHKHLKGDIHFAREVDALNQWLNVVLGIHDETVPFYPQFALDSPVFATEDPNDPVANSKQREILSNIDYLRFDYLTEVKDGEATLDESRLEARIGMTMRGKNPEDDASGYEMRLRDMTYLTNARDFRSWVQ